MNSDRQEGYCVLFVKDLRFATENVFSVSLNVLIFSRFMNEIITEI